MIRITPDYSATLPYSLWTADQVKRAEPKLAAQAQVSLYQLMLLAGTNGFALLRQRWPQAQHLLIIAGGGNNGGDALVIAKLAIEVGMQVSLLVHGDVSRFPAEAAQAWQELSLQQLTQINTLSEAPKDIDVVVDGLLGAGLKGHVRDDAAQLINELNLLELPILALDIPSGLSADTGQALGCALKCDATITFIGVKQGLLTAQAANYCGKLYYSSLGLDSVLQEHEPKSCQRSDYSKLRGLLPKRSRTAHKGMFGRVALFGGDLGTPGAIRMAGEACQRVGAGLVTVISQPENLPIILSGRPELMARGVHIDDEAIVTQFLQATDVHVLGPGLGQSQWSHWLFNHVIASDALLVLDADGLNLLAKSPLERRNWVLTPHPGEASRLLGCSVADIEDDRFSAALEIASKYQAVTLLKGAGSIVASPSGEVRVLNVGNPGMASGGMGDVLSGMIAGLLAQHLPMFESVCLAVCLHGQAADCAAKDGERGMLASDLFAHIRVLVNPEN
ncbi:NAD(P)H-hydrate dehydratase [Celerinatantimonas diazotrophica]|uniref:Bifunctional NAD(P)H-hydrate repair enzyme n=1 Tax=Celerinatantimonas diazotrophica TaxID=412034 RepID=A0A4R1K1T0_9GAMM|nr:NAD(P)H-hydrate dehydratase [Celerinatantimonas diazotrophica]TCK57945.1 NAD(P)H-hydrate epimerase [Celerinatantimonas diazotrophica]